MTGAAITRRRVLGGAVGAVALRSPPSRAADAPPAAPAMLRVMDAAGALRQMQPAFDAYRRARPEWVSRTTFGQAPALKLPGRLKAQQEAGRVEFDLVMAGPDLLAAGIEQGLWLPLLPEHAERLPDLREVLLRPAWNMQELARGQGVVVAYCPSGPLLLYMPGRVGPVPATAEDLLAWARAHPKRFMYPRPATSGAGRSFLMGLPYLLGDADPKDPERGWDKTWAYLRELGAAIESYPTGNQASWTGLREGTRDMVVTTTALDMESRVADASPKGSEIAALKGFHWVSDAHYAIVPRGVPGAKLAVLLDLIGFLLTKEAQAFAYGFGAFYPGPAVTGVGLATAPRRIQDRIRAAERPQYEGLIAGNPAETPLGLDKLTYALRRWDEQIGAAAAR